VTEIKELAEFLKACENEFWHDNPGVRAAYSYHIGKLIAQVQKGALDEEEYTRRWRCESPQAVPTFPINDAAFNELKAELDKLRRLVVDTERGAV